jgi:hypothetical protein
MSKARELERELRNLTLEKTMAQDRLSDLQSRLTKQEERAADLQAAKSALEHDVTQLIGIVDIARTTGNWEVGVGCLCVCMCVCVCVCVCVFPPPTFYLFVIINLYMYMWLIKWVGIKPSGLNSVLACWWPSFDPSQGQSMFR